MLSESTLWLLMILMPLVAFLYASVGHGGASSYIMLLTLFHFVPDQIRPSALLLNIIVSGIAFISYVLVCKFPVQLFLPIIISSIPASYIGGQMAVDSAIYKQILGVLLLFPVLRLFQVLPVNQQPVIKPYILLCAVIGLSIGYVSGLIGIGGGIILSPVLLLLGWTDLKQTAAVSALFIFLNSIAGLIGSSTYQISLHPQLQIIMPLTIVAGIAGAYLGANRFKNPVLKYLLATVLLIAASKFLIAP